MNQELAEPVKKKRNPILKVLNGLIISFLLLSVIVIGGLYFFRHEIIETGIRKVGTFALGTKTSIGSTEWDLKSGTILFDSLSIANPEGFDEKPFLSLGNILVDYDVNSFRQDTLKINRIQLKSIHIYLDKHKGQANYEVILDHLQSLDSTKVKQEKALQKNQLLIKKLTLEDIRVSAILLPIGGQVSRCQYFIDKIELLNLGGENEKTLTTDELFAIVTKALFSSVLQVGSKVLPGPIRDGLGTALGPVFNLGEMGINVMAFTVDGAVDIVGFMGKSVFSAGRCLVNIGKSVFIYESPIDTSSTDGNK